MKTTQIASSGRTPAITTEAVDAHSQMPTAAIRQHLNRSTSAANRLLNVASNALPREALPAHASAQSTTAETVPRRTGFLGRIQNRILRLLHRQPIQASQAIVSPGIVSQDKIVLPHEKTRQLQDKLPIYQKYLEVMSGRLDTHDCRLRLEHYAMAYVAYQVIRAFTGEINMQQRNQALEDFSAEIGKLIRTGHIMDYNNATQRFGQSMTRALDERADYLAHVFKVDSEVDFSAPVANILAPEYATERRYFNMLAETEKVGRELLGAV